ncbi:HNH endonuclease [Streptomyces sp. CB00316]|uniref:HNH endonuclease n=1 Tax=Streptomyces sp. CB00316 TaxID=1703932 RepID=UPI0022791FDD|nr:HNH endonuclease signature motif containing protein [Streptomyces sp. CB00316]
MAQDRPDIPTALKRTVLVEAGHRCAIPTCRQTPVELAHITPWSKTKEHTFDNLIALCPTCHTRFDRGDIDRKAMLQYKLNLEVLNGRYTDVERQVLKVYARILGDNARRMASVGFPSVISTMRSSLSARSTFALGDIAIHRGMAWLLMNLIDDGIVEVLKEVPDLGELPAEKPDGVVALTVKGMELIEKMIAAEPI